MGSNGDKGQQKYNNVTYIRRKANKHSSFHSEFKTERVRVM